MRKSQIHIKSPVNSPLIQLDKLACLDAFVNNYKSLHIVVSVPDCVDGNIQCVRLGPEKRVCTFRSDTLVQQVDIKLEWSYCESERDQ